MGTSRKHLPGERRNRLIRSLAVRDALVPQDAFEREAEPLIRCSECDGLIPFREITVGHVVPLSRNGTNDAANLRLECESCNQEANGLDQFLALVDRSSTRQPESELRDRLRRCVELREAHRLGRVYDSVRVLAADGRHAAYTSLKQVGFMVPAGKIRVVERGSDGIPTTVQLSARYPMLNPDPVLRENRCAACDARKYLKPFRFWPRWHPDWRGARKSHRSVPLCRRCRDQAQRWIEQALRTLVPAEPQPVRDAGTRVKLSILLEAYGRLKRGLALPDRVKDGLRERLGIEIDGSLGAVGETVADLSRRARALKEADERTGREWHQRRRMSMIDAKVDFHDIFWRFLWRRREEYAPYLRTDGTKERIIEGHLRRVRLEWQERGKAEGSAPAEQMTS